MNDLKEIYETDWLASIPVFYNEKSGVISYSINEVIDYNDIELDPEGLCNYLDFGYSVLGQTPIKGVKFLEHSSVIYKENKRLVIERKKDIAENFLSHFEYTKPEEVIELIKKDVNENVGRYSGDIIVPTSGGFDSRLIDSLVEDKRRIKAYTYGISPDQSKSCETVYAKYICEKLGIQWKQVVLGKYNDNLEYWIKEYGVSTCANGIYQTEFIETIAKDIANKDNSVYISGIIGDLWAGSIKKVNIDHEPKHLYKLGYTHGIRVDSDFCKLKKYNDYKLTYRFIKDNENKLNDELWQIVMLIRLKLMLLSYLIKLPKSYGFTNVYAPFLNEEIALKMLALDPEYRKNRNWQRVYFAKEGLMPEYSRIKVQNTNTLNYQALKNSKLKPLKKEILGEYIDEKYIDWVNDNFYKDFSNSFYERLLHTYPGHALLKLLRMDEEGHSLKPYNAYLILKPLQSLLELRR